MALNPWSREFFRDFWDTPEFGRPALTRPAVIFDQHFGQGLREEDLMPPTMYHNYYLRPRRQMSRQLSGSSEVKTEDDGVQIKLDVNQFAPNEIEVKTIDNAIIIEAKHDEKMDDHGFVSRQFTRKYLLPEGVKPECVQSSLSRDGILSIIAPKAAIEAPKTNERVVPIAMTNVPAVADTPAPVGSAQQPQPTQSVLPPHPATATPQ